MDMTKSAFELLLLLGAATACTGQLPASQDSPASPAKRPPTLGTAPTPTQKAPTDTVTSAEETPNAPRYVLPTQAEGAEEVHPRGPRIVVGKEALFADGTRLLTLPKLTLRPEFGVGPENKSSPNDLKIPALISWLQETSQGERTVTLLFDEETPFRLVIEVLFSAREAGRERFVFLTSEAPSPKGFTLMTRPPDDGYLSVLLVSDGISIKGPGGHVAPGCDSIGAGITLPKVEGEYDLTGLGQCLDKINLETGATQWSGAVVANPGVNYANVVSSLGVMKRSRVSSLHLGVGLQKLLP